MRHKFELLMQDFWQALAQPGQDRSIMVMACYGLRRFFPELMRDADKVGQVLDFVQALRSSGTPGRQLAEEQIMESLSDLARHCGGSLDDAKCPRFSGFEMTAAAAGEFQPMLQVLRGLHDFALACFRFKRPRDSFSGTRRGLAFEILHGVGTVVDLPEVVSMARQALKKVNSVEGRQAADFLQRYFTGRGLVQDETMIQELLSMVEATDSRCSAFSALNALVETGAIGEFEALNRMDDWKDKHR